MGHVEVARTLNAPVEAAEITVPGPYGVGTVDHGYNIVANYERAGEVKTGSF